MTSDEHAREAERLLGESKECSSISEARVFIAMAQVHADLSVARATQESTLAAVYGGK